MSKQDKKKSRPVARPGGGPTPSYSAEAQEVRALLRRIPDGQQAALQALATRLAPHRDRVLTELARGLGREILPFFRMAALGAQDEVARAALRVLPVFGTRAAADVLVEVYNTGPETDRGRAAAEGAEALAARGIRVEIAQPRESAGPRLTLRETSVSAPDGAGSRSVAARFQDDYGVWYACLLLWNDQAGVKDGFMRPFSRQEWEERLGRLEDRTAAAIPCPPDFARWQVARARLLNAKTGFPLEDHLGAWDRHVGEPPEGYEPPDPVTEVSQADEEERTAWLAGSKELFRLPAARSWFLEAADCHAWVRRWTDLQSRVRVRGHSEALREEIDQLVTQVARDLLPPEMLRLYRERLVDLARVSGWRHDSLSANRAAAAAAAIDTGLPLEQNPFIVEITRRTLVAAEGLLAQGEDLERLRYRPMRRV